MGRSRHSEGRGARAVEDRADPTWRLYVGKYREFWEDIQVLVLEGESEMIDPSLADPTEAMARLLPVAEHTFRMETEDGFSSKGELIIFEVDEERKVQRVKIGENYAYPQEEC